MDIKLYEAADAVRALLDQMDPETGELPEGFEDASALVAQKSQAVAAYILDTEAQAQMVEDHAKALMARVKAARNNMQRLREYLQFHMAASGVLSIKSDDGTFFAKLEQARDEAIDVFDLAQLPPDYMREIPAKQEPDKTLIKKAIKAGYEVPGARIVAKDRLTIK